MSYSIYLVEDEQNLNEILSYYMKKEEWNVKSFYNGIEAQKMIDTAPHLWVLDIMLPDIDGIQLLKEIKEKTPNVPVIFTSARNTDMDRIIGLELGSDDYLSKPFLPRELIIRIKKILQRVYKNEIQSNDQNEIENIDTYKVDKNRRIVKKDEDNIDLTSKEFDLLILFINAKGQALSREQILEKIWGNDYFYSDRVVDNLIKRLRKKMPDLKIETIYGYGYRRL
ncbi:response regulator transcription factor [Tepidibacter hydrothermalis]|uniref:Stage 0 sporulation protein A homolog n=1 Tax=Tepidibacter hydrothermalis TaxID=3036126 RepID=A0ABY8EDX5_9FIRM|nr:response regulator transcription factor [Tepidibacter hydrothermalis]WFD11117.1 response regulator transcription factor [Tepidibacter hydrothermalis]